MSDQTSDSAATPSGSPTQKKKGLWWKLPLAAVGAIGLMISLFGLDQSLDLEIEQEASALGILLEITNKGKSPISITGLKVNDRDDCAIGPINLSRIAMGQGPAKLSPTELKVGQQLVLGSSCRVVRLRVTTDKGSDTFEFK